MNLTEIITLFEILGIAFVASIIITAPVIAVLYWLEK